MTHTIKIHNCETGEVIERDMTKAEIAHLESVRKDGDAEELVKQQMLVTKAAAQAKLEALGLTADDLKALGL
jgi:hypothetical protein